MAWTTPRNWAQAEFVSDTILNTHIRDNLLALYPVVTTYDPVWGVVSGTAPVINNGSKTGRYSKVGKRVVGEILITMGGATTFGNNTYTFSLPSTAAYSSGPMGVGLLFDAGTNRRVVMAQLQTTTTFNLFEDENVGSGISNTVPFTFASGDQIYAQFCYMEA